MVSPCVLALLIVTAALSRVAHADARAESAEVGAVSVLDAQRTGQGVAIGYENGAFGRGFGQGLRLKIPFNQHWGTRIRVLSVVGTDSAADEFQFDMGGRLELYGESRVLMNLVRLYGGGGVQLFDQVSGPQRGEVSWGGGGQFGFEFFLSPKTAFFIEVGGNDGGARLTGATVMAGVGWYPK